MAARKSRYLALAVALVFAAGPAHSADPKKSETYLNDARSSLKKGDLNAAITQFKNAVLANPDNAAARFELGRVELRQDDLLSAEKELRAAQERNYSEEELSVEFARLYLRQHKYDQLLAEIQPGNRPDEDESIVRLSRGLAYLKLQQISEAEIAINQAIERTSKPSRALIALAQVRQALDDYDGAVATIQRAIDADPKNALAWLTRGQIIHAKHGDVAAVREAFDKAIELQPGLEDARLARAQLLIEANELEPAGVDVNALLRNRPPSAWASYLNAELLVRQHNFRAAESALMNIRIPLDKFPKALFLLATVNLAQNQTEQAETNIDRYLSVVPDDPAGTMFRVDLLTRRGNLQRAIEVLEAATEKNPENAEVLTGLGDAYMRNKQPENAAAALDKVARLYIIKKDDAHALEYAERAFGIAQTPTISDTLGWMLVQKGDMARGLPILEKASTESSGKPQIRYHYAVALMKAGRPADAKRELEMVVRANQPIDEIGDARAMLKDLGG